MGFIASIRSVCLTNLLIKFLTHHNHIKYCSQCTSFYRSKVLLRRNWRKPTIMITTYKTSSFACWWTRQRRKGTSWRWVFLWNGGFDIQATPITSTWLHFLSVWSFLLGQVFYAHCPWQRCKRLRLALIIFRKSPPAYTYGKHFLARRNQESINTYTQY